MAASDIKFSEWNLLQYCWPAIFYFVFALGRICLTLYFNKDASHWFLFFKGLVALAWTYALNWLCRKGYAMVAWALVLLPLALLFTVM